MLVNRKPTLTRLLFPPPTIDIIQHCRIPLILSFNVRALLLCCMGESGAYLVNDV